LRRPRHEVQETVNGPEPEPGDVFFLLRRVRAKFSSDADWADTAARDFLVLDALGGQNWESQADLAERLGINRTIMVQVIDRLEASGDVKRTRDPGNRRQYVLSLTEPGRAAQDDRRLAVAERDARLTAALTRAETARLDELLARLLPAAARPLVQGTENLVGQADLRLRRQGDDKLAATGLRRSSPPGRARSSSSRSPSPSPGRPSRSSWTISSSRSWCAAGATRTTGGATRWR
jgi:DNA-binding MarR family transcriptional regulator